MYSRGCSGHDEREEPAEMVLGQSGENGRIPHEHVHNLGSTRCHSTFFGKKPDLSHVRVFGSIAYLHIPNDTRQKLDPKSEKCILVGYSQEQKGYKFYNPITRCREVSTSRCENNVKNI